MTKSGNRIEYSFLEYSSAITVVLLFISLSRNLIYWRAFNIDVFYYISFSDLIIYSFDVVYNCFFWLLGAVFIFIIINFWSKSNLFFLGLLLVLTIGIFLILYYCYKPYQFPRVLGAVCFFGLLIAMVLAHKIEKMEPYKEIASFICLLIFAYWLARVEAKSQINLVKREKIFFETTIYFKDDSSRSLISDSNAYYLGSIKEFVFWFDERNNSSYVIPISEVKRISIKKRNIRHY